MKKFGTIAAKFFAAAIAAALVFSNSGIKAFAGTVGVGYYVVKDGVTVTDKTEGGKTVGVSTDNFETVISAPAKTYTVDEDALKKLIKATNLNERTNEATTAYSIEVNDGQPTLHYTYSVEAVLKELGLPTEFNGNTIDWYVLKKENDGYHEDGVNLTIIAPEATYVPEDPNPIGNSDINDEEEGEDEEPVVSTTPAQPENPSPSPASGDLPGNNTPSEEPAAPTEPTTPAEPETPVQPDAPAADTPATDAPAADTPATEAPAEEKTEPEVPVQQPETETPVTTIVPVIPFIIVNNFDDNDDVDTEDVTAPEEPAAEEETSEEIIDDIVTTDTPEGAPADEEPEAEVEEEEIVDVDLVTTPESAVEEDVEEEDDVELDVIETPQGDVLPQTGVLSAAVFYGLGSLCVALGGTVVAKIRRKEEE